MEATAARKEAAALRSEISAATERRAKDFADAATVAAATAAIESAARSKALAAAECAEAKAAAAEARAAGPFTTSPPLFSS